MALSCSAKLPRNQHSLLMGPETDSGTGKENCPGNFFAITDSAPSLLTCIPRSSKGSTTHSQKSLKMNSHTSCPGTPSLGPVPSPLEQQNPDKREEVTMDGKHTSQKRTLG